MGYLLLFAVLAGVCLWMELLCRTTLRAVGARGPTGWGLAAVIALAPAVPVAGGLLP